MSAIAADDAALHAGPDGWRLAPEGAAVHPDAQVAVIADVHLGYEWARGRGGDALPAHSLAETVARLEPLLARRAITRLIVAGDLVESPRPCARTADDVHRLTGWLSARRVALIVLAGNHDPAQTPPLPDRTAVAGWTIAHGHRPIRASRTIIGHHHPALRARGAAAPCFLVGPESIVLPAFSPNAAGWNVATACPRNWSGRALRCVACAGGEWLDFGPVDQLARRLRP
jgi:putative SbcD/Mre11-related phosphoesterase